MFKARWEGEIPCTITTDLIKECAKDWGIVSYPKNDDIDEIIYKVLLAADVQDAEEYKPKKYKKR